MEFQKIVEQVLQEDVVAGGAGSAFGPNVGATATTFSGDNYAPGPRSVDAPGDARKPTSLYGGVMTRKGLRKRKSKKRKK